MDLAGEDQGDCLVVGAAGRARPRLPERGVALVRGREIDGRTHKVGDGRGDRGVNREAAIVSFLLSSKNT